MRQAKITRRGSRKSRQTAPAATIAYCMIPPMVDARIVPQCNMQVS